MDTVRIGIIGVGGMGSFHASYLAKGEVAGAQLTAVCDIDPRRLDAAKQMKGDLRTFDSADALFAANCVDAVMIATPHYFHPPLAIQAFQNGCHALSEKPAGVYTKQVREMNEAATKSGKVFGVMFNQRTQGIHQKMRDLVAGGEVGEIHRVAYTITGWLRNQSYYNSGGWRATWSGEGGGVLINQCPHNLDLWQWICGTPSRIFAVCGFGKYHDIEVEDDVTALVEYPNGATGVFITTTGEAPGVGALDVIGDRGRLLMQDGKITFWRTKGSVREHIRTCPGGFDGPEVWKCEIPAGGGDEHIGITRNWVNAIRTGSPLIAPGQEGIKSLQISNAMHLSAWTGAWVDLPVDEERYYALLQEKIRNSTFVKQTVETVNNFGGTF